MQPRRRNPAARTRVDKYDIAAACAVAGIDDKRYHRLSAADQRAIFGFAVCGKKEFRIDPDNQGSITLRKRMIPNDTVFAVYSFAAMASAINEGRALHVG